MWRCFYTIVHRDSRVTVFSTYVEVFLLSSRLLRDCPCFLHVCGGVSREWPKKLKRFRFLHVCGGVSPTHLWTSAAFQFSPRMWRCFHLFQTLDVIEESFLHVCGGSAAFVGKVVIRLFSPRMWRCFPRRNIV